MTLRVAMAQMAARVGDLDGNVARILAMWRQAAERGADVAVFTELAITGYPPEDLLLKPEFLAATDAALNHLRDQGPPDTVAIVGTVATAGDRPEHGPTGDVSVPARDLRNRAVAIHDGQIVATYDKWRLPNYGVFDEARYFVAVDRPCVLAIAGVAVGLTICEDLWTPEGPAAAAGAAGARVIVNLNASPWHLGKADARAHWVTAHARAQQAWVVYVNVVGGHDDVVFDGGSMLSAPDGAIVARGARFEEDLVVVDLPVAGDPDWSGPSAPGHAGPRPALASPRPPADLSPAAATWAALVLATRDYVLRNGFEQVVVAISGGIDSAVVAAIAADALGPAHVLGLLLPSPYSSAHSLTDARALAANLGIRTHEVPIAPAMTAFDDMLADVLAAEGTPRRDQNDVSLTEENIQSRIRGLTVMAVSNDTGALVLTTGNKSEYAVGYATLYGDMNGAFGPLKDCPKTFVYELARHRAAVGPSIPAPTIAKPPSAELRPGQTDQDSLPAYDVLDDIIARYVESNQGIDEIVAAGHDDDVVRDVVARIDRAEFKRRQAAPGPKVTSRAFGKERRVPVTHHWRG